MKVSVIGFKRMTGTSTKTGKAYDFYSVNIAYHTGDAALTGCAIKQIPISPKVFEQFANSVKTLPAVADVEFSFSGNAISVSV